MMKFVYEESFRKLEQNLSAFPQEIQGRVYGAGCAYVARKSAIKARRFCPRRAKQSRESIRRFGRQNLSNIYQKRRLKKPLYQSIYTKRVAWHWYSFGGLKRVKRSAALIIALQPHAHLVENGTFKNKAKPFLKPSIADKRQVIKDFQTGTREKFRKYVNDVRNGKYRGKYSSTAKIFNRIFR